MQPPKQQQHNMVYMILNGKGGLIGGSLYGYVLFPFFQVNPI